MAVGRGLAIPLLVMNFLMVVIILGISGRILDRIISSMEDVMYEVGGNDATFYVVLFSILAGAASVAAVITGLHHVRVWSTRSGAAAQATAWISWMLVVLSFLLVCKEIYLPGGRGFQLKVLEICIIVLTFTHFLYSLTLYIGDGLHRNQGPSPTGR